MARPLRPLLLGVLLISRLTAQDAIPPVVAEVESIQKRDGFQTALLGFAAVPVSAEDPQTAIIGYQMDAGLVPASTQKVITTATGLEILGPDFVFETALQYRGSIDEEGTLKGDIIVRGGGDPTLAESQIANTFSKWQSAMTEAGIQKVDGAVIGDASIFDSQLVPDSWQWNDMGNYYGAGACGLTIHQNLFYCSFRTPYAGASAEFVGTDPRLPGVEFFNEMRVGAAGSGDQGYIYGHPYSNVMYLRGTVPAGSATFTIKGSLPDPAFFCARAFTKHLNSNGISVSGEPTTDRLLRQASDYLDDERTDLYSQTSGKLSDMIVLTNHKSNNLRAECIHRMIGLNAGREGSTKAAASAVENHWRDQGIDMAGFFMGDGCGLSRNNSVTARQMTMILYQMAQSENFDAFYSSLPVAGRSGTLKSIGGGSAAEGRVHAKSGTLDRIRNYAGYITAYSGERYAFTIFVNNYSGELWEVKSQVVRLWTKMLSL